MSKNKKNLTIYKVDAETFMPLPYADGGIKAGFPSPAQDYISQAIDLNKELIHHPSTTFTAGNGNLNKNSYHSVILLI